MGVTFVHQDMELSPVGLVVNFGFPVMFVNKQFLFVCVVSGKKRKVENVQVQGHNSKIFNLLGFVFE